MLSCKNYNNLYIFISIYINDFCLMLIGRNSIITSANTSDSLQSQNIREHYFNTLFCSPHICFSFSLISSHLFLHRPLLMMTTLQFVAQWTTGLQNLSLSLKRKKNQSLKSQSPVSQRVCMHFPSLGMLMLKASLQGQKYLIYFSLFLLRLC